MRRALLAILTVCALPAAAGTVVETFRTDPISSGWREFGDGRLFGWSAENENLEVTWDSSRSNSYFYLPLGNILTETDDFALGFDVRLADIAIGTTSGKPFTFQIAIGLFGFEDAVRDEFYRAAGINPAHGPRNAVEFDYFPDSGFGATFAPTVVSSNNVIAFSDNHPLELTTDDWFHVELRYTGGDATLRTTVERNGVPYGLDPGNSIRDLVLTGYPGFRVDTVGVMSYSDEGQMPVSFSGSVLAHGWIDNVELTLPPPPITDVAGRVQDGRWRVEFPTREGWQYRVERTLDFRSWTTRWEGAGDGGVGVVEEELSAGASWFYRLEAWRP